MDPVSVIVWVTVVATLIFSLFQAKFWGKIFGIEYFDEKYSLQSPMSVREIRDSFISLRLSKYQKNIYFNIDMKIFYSVGHGGLDDWSDWSDWIVLEHKSKKSFDDYDIRYKYVWTITIYGPDLHCTVYHDDSNLLCEEDIYSEIRLVGLEIIKFPWNRRKIKKERQFLADIASALKEAENKCQRLQDKLID